MLDRKDRMSMALGLEVPVCASTSTQIVRSPGSDCIDGNKQALPPFGQSIAPPISLRGRGKAFDDAVSLKRPELSQHDLRSNARQKSLEIAHRGRMLSNTPQQTRLPFTAYELNDMLNRAWIERR